MQNRKKPKAEKMPEKVFLTVGRHGRYSYGARLPLSESSILEGVYRGQELTAAYGSLTPFTVRIFHGRKQRQTCGLSAEIMPGIKLFTVPN